MINIHKITLKKISKLNLIPILQLKVKPEQTGLVAPNAVSIAQASFSRDAWFRAICADDIPIGFVMISDTLLKYRFNPNHRPAYIIWRFMLDLNYQDKGYGKKAMKLIINHIRTRPKAKEIFLSHSQLDGNAGAFYKKCGFEYTGSTIGDELVMSLKL